MIDPVYFVKLTKQYLCLNHIQFYYAQNLASICKEVFTENYVETQQTTFIIHAEINHNNSLL